MLAEEGLLKGNTVSVDGTTWKPTRRCARSSAEITVRVTTTFSKVWQKNPASTHLTREQLAKLDRKRMKKGNNDDWKNPHDPDAQITKMKDGRTHRPQSRACGVDLETGAVLAVTLQPATAGDTNTLQETLTQCGEHIWKWRLIRTIKRSN